MALLRHGESEDESSDTDPTSPDEEEEGTTPAPTIPDEDKGKGPKKRDFEEEDEEEEEPPLIRKRCKQTVGKRGSPSGVVKEQEQAPEPWNGTPKKVQFQTGSGQEGFGERKVADARASPMTPADLDNAVGDLVRVMSLIKADWYVKNETLNQVAELVGGKALEQLPETVASRISDPEETRKAEERYLQQTMTLREMDELVLSLRGELQLTKNQLDASREEAKAARAVQEETRAAIDRMVESVGASGEARAKAVLFDEEMHKEKKLSGTRIARILADFASELEASLRIFREAAKQVEDSCRKLQMDHPISLSGLSIPDDLDDVQILGEKGATPVPQPKASGSSAPKTTSPGDPAVKSRPASPPDTERIPEGGDKVKNLSDVEGWRTPDSGGP